MDQVIKEYLLKYSSSLNDSFGVLSIILAAGHGKRIKSERSKMLHTIWGKPSVTRVLQAVKNGLGQSNQVVVVGIKAREVIETVAKQENTVYAYQEEQKGTGHAAQIAIDCLSNLNGLQSVFVFPGDMGLITDDAVMKVKNDFDTSNYDMIIMTGTYYGDPQDNYYGRVVRVPEYDAEGNQSPDSGEVIEILEFKDILSVGESGYYVSHKGLKYHFTQDDLLAIPEFNAGVYGFKAEALISNIKKIRTDNVQGEVYLTDLVSILNQNGYKIGISQTQNNDSILGFNIKSVLKEMESIARKAVYNKIKDIITIEDEDDFFIDDAVVDRILEMDKKGEAVDIVIGKGVYLGKNIYIKKGVKIEKNAFIDGFVFIDEHTFIGSGCSMDNYIGQKICIGRSCQLLTGTVIRGNVTLRDFTRIESGVRVTGSNDYPAFIEENVLIKGTTYIFGSYIEKDVEVEHSILKRKRVERIVKKDGSIQAIRYCLPLPEGLDSLSDV